MTYNQPHDEVDPLPLDPHHLRKGKTLWRTVAAIVAIYMGLTVLLGDEPFVWYHIFALPFAFGGLMVASAIVSMLYRDGLLLLYWPAWWHRTDTTRVGWCVEEVDAIVERYPDAGHWVRGIRQRGPFTKTDYDYLCHVVSKRERAETDQRLVNAFAGESNDARP